MVKVSRICWDPIQVYNFGGEKHDLRLLGILLVIICKVNTYQKLGLAKCLHQ